MKNFFLTVIFVWPLLFPQRDLLATVIPNGIFADHMVLQRDEPIQVWGQAEPGEKVSVTLDRSKSIAVADNRGFWKCKLSPQPATASSKSMSITSDRMAVPIAISDILIGDVWLCAGQSNMTLYLKYLTNFPGVSKDITAADLPLIRQGVVARQPSITRVESRTVSWSVCSPDTVGMFSAPGFYFSRMLQKETGVPIGLLLSSFGSTCTDGWISKETLQADPDSKKRMEQQQERFSKELAAYQDAKTWYGSIKGKIRNWLFKESLPNPSKILNKTATAHFNGMIAPLAPFPIKGVIWYQGEEEALEKRPKDHARQLPLLIGDWRKLWGNLQMPFVIQQLPEFKGAGVGKTEWAEVREAQSRVVEKTPGAYLVCGLGAGEVEGLHPANKQEIGNRWALRVLKEVYGKNLPSEGPAFGGIKVQDGRVRVFFKNTHGLRTSDGQLPRGFEIAGADGQYWPAEASIEGETVVLAARKVSVPAAVRYAFLNAPMDLNLSNDSGLPAFPFRSGIQ